MEKLIQPRFACPPSPLLLIIYSFDSESSHESYLLVCKSWSNMFNSSIGVKFLKNLAWNSWTGTAAVIQNSQTALRLYRQAAAQRDNEAEAMLAFCYLDMKLNDKEAFRLSNLGVEKNVPLAFRNLGHCYMFGNGVSVDVQKGIQLYERGVELGEAYAMSALALCYRREMGVKKDVDKAIHLYRLAIEQGNSKALNNLGYCYDEGIGVMKDGKEAVRLYRLAAEQGNPYAQYNLGVCCEQGIGTVKNLEEAFFWYEKGARQGHESSRSKLRSKAARAE